MNANSKELIFEIINSGKKVDRLEEMSVRIDYPVQIKEASAKVRKLGLNYKNTKNESLLSTILDETNSIYTKISNEVRSCLMIRLKEGDYPSYPNFVAHTANMELFHVDSDIYTLKESISPRWGNFSQSSVVSRIDLSKLSVEDLFHIYSGVLSTYTSKH